MIRDIKPALNENVSSEKLSFQLEVYTINIIFSGNNYMTTVRHVLYLRYQRVFSRARRITQKIRAKLLLL